MGRFFSDDANCGRARSWISHEVDGELSQLERLFLAAHVRRCGQCARFSEDVHAFTQIVRSAPLERPERQFEIPARRPVAARVVGRVAIAVALVAFAGGLGVLAGSNGGGPSRPQTPAVGDVALVVPQSVDRERPRRIEIEEPRERVSPPGRLGGNA
jgi:anti-sigma factor RsiW